MTFDGLGLRAALLRAVREQGYTLPTTVQARAIPAILTGRDVMAAAKSGSGKTAAFALPMLQLLMGVRSESSRAVRALVMVPTRELASQVARSIQTYGAHMPFHCSAIVCGVGNAPQFQALRRGADIVVATPRLLLEHARSGNVDLSRVGILVLDEAARIFDMGGIHDVRPVLALMPARRQNLLFCTTFPDLGSATTGQLLEDPELIEDGLPDGTPTEMGHSSGCRADLDGETGWLAELAQRDAFSGTLGLLCTGEPPGAAAGRNRYHRRRNPRRYEPVDHAQLQACAHVAEELSR